MSCIPPWVWWRRARAAAVKDVITAREELEAAEQRRADAHAQAVRSHAQAAESRAVSAQLRTEILKNGWTELLQHSWGAR